MPRKNSKYDVVQYCMRLNLNNPEHLEVHKIMQNLNRENYKSQTAFMAQAILETFSRYSEEEILSDAAAERKKKEKYITRGEFEVYKESLKKELLEDITSLLISSLSKGSAGIQFSTNNETAEEPEAVEDDVLADLSKQWA